VEGALLVKIPSLIKLMTSHLSVYLFDLASLLRSSLYSDILGRPWPFTMSSKLSRAIKFVADKPQNLAHRQFVDRLVRVDQAGELAADYIYWGQYLAFRKQPELEPLIKHMWEQEIHHHKTFDSLQIDGRVRPSLFTPLWKVMSFALGYGTALRGKEAAMACTEAVETVIGGHYNSQLRYLHENLPKSENSDALKQIVSQFRDDELEHLDTAVEHDAHGAKPYWLLTETIKQGCRVAIGVAERV